MVCAPFWFTEAWKKRIPNGYLAGIVEHVETKARVGCLRTIVMIAVALLAWGDTVSTCTLLWESESRYTVPMLISDAAYGALLTVLMSLVANVFALTCAHRISRRALMLGALIVSTVLVFPLLFDKESIAYLLTLAAQFAAIFLAFFGVYLYVVEVRIIFSLLSVVCLHSATSFSAVSIPILCQCRF